jgi:glyoxylase-like metal-dependent hydrolase (beta-lactamase superfamily II)
MREDPDYARRFLQSDSCIRKEYAGGVPLIVVPADEEVPDGFEINLGGVTARLLYAESPHTEDGLLVYVPEDQVLYIGDAQLGEFPSWRMDYRKLAALADRIRRLDVKTVVDGHWGTYRKAAFLEELGY